MQRVPTDQSGGGKGGVPWDLSALRKLGQIWYFAYYSHQNCCCQPIQTGWFLAILHKETDFFVCKGLVRYVVFLVIGSVKTKWEKSTIFRNFAKKNHKKYGKRGGFGLKITI